MGKEYICIECPAGCCIQVEKNDSGYIVSGNGCNRGRLYVINEEICPRRVLTTTVKLSDGRMLPVKSSEPVKKENIFPVMERLKSVTIKAPVKIGDVVIKDIEDGINIIASANR